QNSATARDRRRQICFVSTFGKLVCCCGETRGRSQSFAFADLTSVRDAAVEVTFWPVATVFAAAACPKLGGGADIIGLRAGFAFLTIPGNFLGSVAGFRRAGR